MENINSNINIEEDNEININIQDSLKYKLDIVKIKKALGLEN